MLATNVVLDDPYIARINIGRGQRLWLTAPCNEKLHTRGISMSTINDNNSPGI